MITPTQSQQENVKLRYGSGWLYWFHLVIVITALLFFVATALLWVFFPELRFGALSLVLLFPGTLLAALLLIFQWVFYRLSIVDEYISTAASITPMTSTFSPNSQVTPLSVKEIDADTSGLLPPTDFRTIQQRQKVVREVYKELIKHDASVVVLTGIGGVGKSTLAALIYRFAEEQRHAKRGIFQAHALWLKMEVPSTTIVTVAEKLFKALGKSMLDFSGLSPHEQALALFHAMNTTKQPRLIILDQFESLLDWQTSHILPDHASFSEWLNVLNSRQCLCRVLLTSHAWPKGEHVYFPTRMREHLVKGLDADEGVELLRKQGVDTSETELRIAVKSCGGHAYALTLLASILQRNRGLRLATLLNNPMYIRLWQGDIARNLLDYIFKDQLNAIQKKLLLGFSVYREDIPLEGVLAVVDFSNGASKSEVVFALHTLLTQHLLEPTEEDRYELHAVVADYARNHFVENNEQENQLALEHAHAKTLKYYSQQLDEHYISPNQRKEIEDIHLQIEMIWQMYQAKLWEDAYNFMEKENLFDELKRFGGNEILLELYQPLLPIKKWTSDTTKMITTYGHLGRIYRTLGKKEEARNYLEEALQLCEQEGEVWEKGAMLSYLGRVCADMGQRERALRYFEQALSLRRDIGDHEGEGWTLDNMGRVYSELGHDEKALDYSQQALKILRKEGNRKGQGRTLSSLGRILTNLGRKEEALEYLEQALEISQTIGDRGGEGRALHNLGLLYGDLGRKEKAREFYERALHIRKQIRNRRGEGRTLQNLGIIYHDLGQVGKAIHYFMLALNVLREVGDLAGEASTLYYIGVLYSKQGREDTALACCLLARNIFEGIQSPTSNDNQKLIETICEEMGTQEFNSLLAKVELNADLILEDALRKEL